MSHIGSPLLKLLAFAPALVGAAVLGAPLGFVTWLIHVSGGLVAWTFLEYLLHRFAHESSFSFGDGRRPHLGHHARPTDLSVMVTPLSFTLPVTVVLWAFLRLTLGGWAPASAVLLGVLAGYFAYEVVHYRVHMASRPGPLLRWLRGYHFDHHFRDSSSRFGVTTPLWDFVFRSGAIAANEALSDLRD